MKIADLAEKIKEPVTEELLAALERMEEMDTEELDAFRSADASGEFGAAHLESIKRAMEEEDGDLVDLLRELLDSERAKSPPPPPRVELRIEKGGAKKVLFMPVKVMLAGVVVAKFVNGRQVDEIVVQAGDTQRGPTALFAHEDDPRPFGRAIEDFLESILDQVMSREANPDPALD